METTVDSRARPTDCPPVAEETGQGALPTMKSRNVNGYVEKSVSFEEMYPKGSEERATVEAKLAKIGGLDWMTVCTQLDSEMKELEAAEKAKREADRVKRY